MQTRWVLIKALCLQRSVRENFQNSAPCSDANKNNSKLALLIPISHARHSGIVGSRAGDLTHAFAQESCMFPQPIISFEKMTAERSHLALILPALLLHDVGAVEISPELHLLICGPPAKLMVMQGQYFCLGGVAHLQKLVACNSVVSDSGVRIAGHSSVEGKSGSLHYGLANTNTSFLQRVAA